MTPTDDGHALTERRLDRERRARAQAEQLLEAKSLELYQSNEALKLANVDLEQRVAARTDALRTALEEARGASRSKSEFLSNMSHELRTPMNGVLGLLQLVLDEPLADDVRHQLATAKDCAESLLSLLNDLLDLAKIESGHLELERAPFDLKNVCHTLDALFAEKARRQGITLTMRIDPAVPEWLVGDATRLRQILVNMIGNAIKFTAQGGVCVELALAERATEHLMLRARITDTGIGLTAVQASRLFADFVQADASITRRFGGSGLGLSICRRMAQSMGGTVGVESELGKGSRFWFTARFEARGEPITALGDAGAPPTWRAPPGARALLVDDNAVNRLVGQKIVSKLGLACEVAESGAAALSRLARERFDVVLMDCQMPGMDGAETVRRLRRGDEGVLDPRVPVVALTAQAMHGDREACLAAGMDGYVTKPLLVAELTAELARTVRAPEAVAPITPPG
ncbi:MAG: response regulator [Planctomycetes bacterium]|nr:response regulator [Planctomycetota bacterium]